MVTKITDGIYQLKIPIPNNPLENTNVYLMRGVKDCTLIDTGWGDDEAFNALCQQMAEIGVSFQSISQIVVTHAHFDHYGLAGRVKQLSHAKLYMHNADREIFRTRYAVTEEFVRQSEQWFRNNGVPLPKTGIVRMPFGGMGKPVPAQPDVMLNGGETIQCDGFTLKVIWTPGHSPGHICLYEQNCKILFAGDHILPVITPNVSLVPHSEENPLGDFLKSLLLIKNLDVTLVLPAHEAIFNNLPKRVDEIIQHHEMRSTEIMQALDCNKMTAFEISNMITWMPELGGVKFADLMPGDKRAAVSETLAHLRAMSLAHKVIAGNQNGIVYYQRIC
ncbi:MAG: MBL fold metallo-hydrolase [Dehalococcoidales bacterium]|nr:MBL fold metallo-hydrolase [Dehalococcoidales bacterium]